MTSLWFKRIRRATATVVLSVLATVTGLVGSASPALASTAYKYVCGGVKHGAGWQTASSGGFVGEGCGAGIDWHATPFPADSSVNVYWYFPDLVNGRTYTQMDIGVYIPTTTNATAKVYFMAYCGASALLPGVIVVDESATSGWLWLLRVTGRFTYSGGCTPYLKSWQAATGNTRMGYDAAYMDLAW